MLFPGSKSGTQGTPAFVAPLNTSETLKSTGHIEPQGPNAKDCYQLGLDPRKEKERKETKGKEKKLSISFTKAFKMIIFRSAFVLVFAGILYTQLQIFSTTS